MLENTLAKQVTPVPVYVPHKNHYNTTFFYNDRKQHKIPNWWPNEVEPRSNQFTYIVINTMSKPVRIENVWLSTDIVVSKNNTIRTYMYHYYILSPHRRTTLTTRSPTRAAPRRRWCVAWRLTPGQWASMTTFIAVTVATRPRTRSTPFYSGRWMRVGVTLLLKLLKFTLFYSVSNNLGQQSQWSKRVRIADLIWLLVPAWIPVCTNSQKMVILSFCR